jgi:UDP-N-acetylmuramoyl-L-alanyl-D-glutamate--2,6-diaminopimelate ligase
MPALKAPPVPRLGELLAGIADAGAAANLPVEGLATDSRRLNPGEVFLACQGRSYHALDHLDEALSRGASAVLWEPSPAWVEFPKSAAVVNVPVSALSQCLGPIASRYYDNPAQSMTVVGITGTDGKTSVSQLLAQALDQEAAPCGVIGTLGCGRPGALIPGLHTTPDALTLQRTLAELRDAGARWISMEVSSHALDQGRVNGTAIDYAVLTNLSRDHLDYHGDMQSYAQAKRRLFEVPGLDTAILNIDDAFGRELVAQLRAQTRVLGYGLGDAAGLDCEAVLADRLEPGPRGLRARVRTPWGSGELESRLLGRFNLQNLLAVLTTLLAIGIELTEALLRLRELHAVPGRMEVVPADPGSPLAVVDYAHTPAALTQVLEALREHCAGRLWCVFGCGGDRDRGKRALMADAAERLSDRIVVTDDNPRTEDPERIVQDILAGLGRPEQARVERDRGRAISLALGEAGPEDVVLIAGKGHEEVQIVGTECRPFSDREQVERALRGGGR